MTGEDHQELIAALRSPALPSEHGGEDAAVAAMLDALPAAVSARRSGHRSRRGVAVAVVTIASLGVGGLVAAGPGRFLLPDVGRSSHGEPGRSATTDPADRASLDAIRRTDVTTTTSSTTPALVGSLDAAPDADADLDEDPACVDDNHGEAVSESARTTEPGDVRDTARSDCGKPEEARGPGDTPADTAPGRTGDTPANTAPGRTGDTPADTAPGRTGDAPAHTTPAQPGATPVTPDPPASVTPPVATTPDRPDRAPSTSTSTDGAAATAGEESVGDGTTGGRGSGAGGRQP